MDSAHAAVERTIDAPPAAIYAVLADYSTHHPRIMPASYFSDLEVEEGGVGTGTVFHITLKALQARRNGADAGRRAEPGRVLTETNLDTGRRHGLHGRPCQRHVANADPDFIAVGNTERHARSRRPLRHAAVGAADSSEATRSVGSVIALD